jgi:Mn2+/Fe2+ NRAMP family transporter
LKYLPTRLGSVLFWSVISAAFIGPGTVTTAAAAGGAHGPQLLWALTFATFGCIYWQELAARLQVVAGLSLGHALASWAGAGWAKHGVAWAVVLGCAAYQAGNLLGAVAGLELVLGPRFPWILVAGVGLAATGLLWWGHPQRVAQLLGLLVAAMGLMFALAAAQTPWPLVACLQGAVWPQVPPGGWLLVVGLVGTTIVPYNLFLGSGLGQGQSLTQMRFGLAGAVLIGGLISAAILLAGTLVTGPFSYAAVAEALRARLGPWGAALFGWGLFAAGFTSAITAPLAAAITLKTTLGANTPGWEANGRYYRATWLGVMLFGLAFGLAGVRPIPVILLAQAANGLLLPLVCSLLLWLANRDQWLPPAHQNGRLANWVGLGMVWVTALLGLRSLGKALLASVGVATEEGLLLPALLLATGLTAGLAWQLYRHKKAPG